MEDELAVSKIPSFTLEITGITANKIEIAITAASAGISHPNLNER